MSRITPLHDREQALGATFTTAFGDDGYEIPAHFGDAIAEHLAVRRAAGLFDATATGYVEASGPHRVRFLNGQVTNDVQALEDGRGTYAVTLSPTGRMVADLRIYAVGETFLLATPPGRARAVIDHLLHFRVADRVAFTDVSARLGGLLVQGPAAEAVVRAALGGTPPAEPYANVSRPVEGGEVRVCRHSATGEPGFELLSPVERLPALYDRLLEVGRPLGLVPAGHRALDSLRLEAGIAWFGVDMDDSTNPLEARLARAISLQKGCYTGQEVVAKATYVGQVPRLLVGLLFPDGTRGLGRGDVLRFAEREAGTLTSLGFAPTLDRDVGLAIVRREAAEAETRLVVAPSGGRESRPAVVVDLPFYRR